MPLSEQEGRQWCYPDFVCWHLCLRLAYHTCSMNVGPRPTWDKDPGFPCLCLKAVHPDLFLVIDTFNLDSHTPLRTCVHILYN